MYFMQGLNAKIEKSEVTTLLDVHVKDAWWSNAMNEDKDPITSYWNEVLHKDHSTAFDFDCELQDDYDRVSIKCIR